MNKSQHKFSRILIANRGEIAVRIIKTAKKMGIETVAIYTEAEKDALHVQKADLKALLIGSTINETYLNANQIVQTAKRFDVEAIHPGYGFLSENEDFAQLCIDNQIVFIGPSPHQIKMMGNKDEANKIAIASKIPLLKKVNGTLTQMLQKAQQLNLPILIKAAAGGGGKGMRVVHKFDDLENEITRASAEAERYFGNPSVYLEEYVENPRHIEVQILADNQGNTIHLHERECSIQRRHQKVIEEAPAPNLNTDVKNKILDDALTIAKHIDYTNAGTVEFLLTKDQQHFFLEMNTRIQVEHPVTEEITGIDIVQEQILIASGNALTYRQNDIKISGHAIEARIYAEDPNNDFSPSFGKIIGTHIPSHPNIRIDGGAQPEENLNPNFDPLLKKIIAHSLHRKETIEDLTNFLNNYALFGVNSNREFIIQSLKDRDFINGNYSTSFFKVKKDILLQGKTLQKNDINAIAAAFTILKNETKLATNNIWNQLGYWRMQQEHHLYFDDNATNIIVDKIDSERTIIQIDKNRTLEISNIEIEQNELSFIINEERYSVNYLVDKNESYHIQYNGVKRVVSDRPQRIKQHSNNNDRHIEKSIKAPIPGKIIDIMVKEGELIKKGNPLMLLEAMKTENSINAPQDTMITKISVNKGQQVSLNQLLLETE